MQVIADVWGNGVTDRSLIYLLLFRHATHIKIKTGAAPSLGDLSYAGETGMDRGGHASGKSFRHQRCILGRSGGGRDPQRQGESKSHAIGLKNFVGIY